MLGAGPHYSRSLYGVPACTSYGVGVERSWCRAEQVKVQPLSVQTFKRGDEARCIGFCNHRGATVRTLALVALGRGLPELMDSPAELAAEARFGNVGVGWQVIPTPSHVLDRISPVSPPFSSFFARFHCVDEAVPTSPKPEPMAKRQWQGRPNTVLAV